eukprot:g1429.t1
MELFKDIGIEKCVIKPVYSRGGLDVLICNNSNEVLNNNRIIKTINNSNFRIKNSKITRSNPHVVQPFVDGTHLSTFSIAINGKILLHTCYKTSLPFKGFGTIREEVYDIELYDWCKHFVEATKYTGHIGFDFIRGHIGARSSTFHRRRTFKEIDESSCVYAIECNPRTTNGLDILLLKHGGEIFKAYLKMLIDSKASDCNKLNYVPNLQPHNVIRLRTSVPSIIAAFQLKTAKDIVDSLKIIIFDTNDDMFWWSDPFPFFLMFIRALVQFLSSIYMLIFLGIPVTQSGVESIRNELITYPPEVIQYSC